MPDPVPTTPETLGRPVYFVRPHSVLQEQLLTELIRHEHEVAVLEDHTRVAALLRLHPDSIVFLNIDEGYKPAEWESLVTHLQKDAGSAKVRLGVLTYNDDPALSRKYLLELGLSAGFVKLSLGLNESTQTILKVLEANEAKGRRQYLRVRCRDNTGTFNIGFEGRHWQGTLVELSSSAMAGYFQTDPGLPGRALIGDLQLRLYGTLCPASALALGSRWQDDREVRYFLFDPKTPDATKERIRWFLRKTLQSNLEQEMAEIPS